MDKTICITISHYDYSDSYLVNIAEGKRISTTGKKYMGLAMGRRFPLLLLFKAWRNYKKNKKGKTNE